MAARLLSVALVVVTAVESSATSLGNHVYEVQCDPTASAAQAAWVRIPWRRQAVPSPKKTTCIVVDAKGSEIGNRVDSVGRAGLDAQDAGDIAFQPSATVSGANSSYKLYCFPYNSTGSTTGVSYEAHYLTPYDRASPSWRQANHLTEQDLNSGSYRTALPRCTFTGYSSRTQFDAFTDTALVANTTEVATLRALGSDVVLFAGDRRAPLKTFGDRPAAGWVLNKTRLFPDPQVQEILEPEAASGETVALQIGLWVSGAVDLSLADADVIVAPLVPESSATSVKQDVNKLPSGCPSHSSRANEAPHAPVTSIGTRGMTDSGEPLSQTLTFKSGMAGALWFVVQMPAQAVTGLWCGSVALTFRGNGIKSVSVTVPLSVNVSTATPLPEGGAADTWRLARAGWLDSQLGLEDVVTRRYSPVVVSRSSRSTRRGGAPSGNFSVGITGRTVEVSGSGSSLFSSTSAIGPSGKPGDMQKVLGDATVQVNRSDGTAVQWVGNGTTITSGDDSVSKASWSTSASSSAGDLWMKANVTAWFDGFLEVDFAIGAVGSAPVDLREVSLPLHLSEGVCSLVMGLEMQGQSISSLAGAPTAANGTLIDWVWGEHVNEGSYQVWVGSTWGGVRAKLKGQGHGSNYGWESPLHQVELTDMPNSSWAGDSMSGGVRLLLEETSGSSGSTASAAPGDSTVGMSSAGQKWLGSPGACSIILRSGSVQATASGTPFKLDLVLTPVRPLDGEEWRRHFQDRYYQYGYNGELSPPQVHEFNATVFDTHQGQKQNPYINYLFREDTVGVLRNWTDLARDSGMIASEVYYTTRELSNRAYEQWILWAIQSAGGDGFYVTTPEDQIATSSRGNAWLQEHLGSVPYTPAWQTNLPWAGAQDAALHNSGQSRWNNFYIQGLNFAIASPIGPRVNGVYIDETAFSRLTATRMRRAEEASALAVAQASSVEEKGVLEATDGTADRWQAAQIVRNNLHSCNKFTCRTGDSHSTVLKASSALIYAAHLATFDRLWLGEAFSAAYTKASPDYWLAEMSGIPFGLTASMLDMPIEALYRGMAAGLEDNRPATCVWPVWVDLGLDQGDAEVFGWWNASVPVRVVSVNGNASLASEVLVSVVKREPAGASAPLALVAIGNFASGDLAKEQLQVTMSIDWASLFGSKTAGKASQPTICKLQAAMQLPAGDTLSLTIGALAEPTNGRLVVLRPSA